MSLDLVALVRRELLRQAEAIAEIAPEHERLLGGVVAWAGPDSWANRAIGVGLDGPATDEALDQLVAFYARRGVPARVELAPYADPTVIAGLARRGFVIERFENVLVRPLPPGEDLRAALPHPWPDGIEIRPVAPAERDAFVEVSTSGFRPEGAPLPDADRQIAEAMLAHPLAIAVIAWDGDRPVGAGGAEARGEAAALFGASVLPGWRRRGVQAAMIVARLEAARARGATVAAIESLPGIPTERNAMRLGFVIACTKVLLVRPHVPP